MAYAASQFSSTWYFQHKKVYRELKRAGKLHQTTAKHTGKVGNDSTQAKGDDSYGDSS
jgi:hypothetical protein